MDERELKKLEAAVNYVKRNGFEAQMASDLIEANKLLLRLRRLERIRAEILELKQSTVAEIRSYQKPPPVVVHVMTAVFIILAHKEKELKVKSLLHLYNQTVRAWHWCFPHCPGEVEFVNYSWRASKNCILLVPVGRAGKLYIFQVNFRERSVVLVLENMLSHASTMFYMVLNETL